MIPLFRASAVADSVLDIDYEALLALGKDTLLFDFDKTLAPRGWRTMPDASDALLRRLFQQGFRVAILTNRRRHRTVAKVSCPMAYHARKPRRRGYRQMLETLASSPGQAVVIGDRWMTDILGGRRLGMYTIRVRRPPAAR